MRVLVRKRVKGVGSHPLVGAPRGTILIDSRVRKGKRRKAVIFHEKIEYAGMRGGLSYKKAHRKATTAERKVFFPIKRDWKKHNKMIMRIHRSGK